MWNIPSKQILNHIPRLYETEDVSLKDKLIWLHFFVGSCEWYIAEYDGKDRFFGFVILNNDFEMAEWGYIAFSELRDLKIQGWLEIDCEREEFWEVRPASKIAKICKAQGWVKEKINE